MLSDVGVRAGDWRGELVASDAVHGCSSGCDAAAAAPAASAAAGAGADISALEPLLMTSGCLVPGAPDPRV